MTKDFKTNESKPFKKVASVRKATAEMREVLNESQKIHQVKRLENLSDSKSKQINKDKSFEGTAST